MFVCAGPEVWCDVCATHPPPGELSKPCLAPCLRRMNGRLSLRCFGRSSRSRCGAVCAAVCVCYVGARLLPLVWV